MRKYIAIWFFLSFFVLGSISSLVMCEETETLNTIIKNIKFNDSLIVSLKGEFEFVINSYLSPSVKKALEKSYLRLKPYEKSNVLWAVQGEKIRNDFISIDEKEDTTLKYQRVFDGEVSTEFSPKDKRAYINDKKAIESYTDPLFYVGLKHHDGHYWGEVLEKNRDRVSLEKSDIIGDYSCYIIKIELEDGYVFKVWIAPEIGYRPVKVESYNSQKKLVYIKEPKYKKYTDNIWFPAEGVYSLYADNGKKWEEEKITVVECSINEKIPDDFFSIKFPSGTLIFDTIHQTNTVIP